MSFDPWAEDHTLVRPRFDVLSVNADGTTSYKLVNEVQANRSMGTLELYPEEYSYIHLILTEVINRPPPQFQNPFGRLLKTTLLTLIGVSRLGPITTWRPVMKVGGRVRTVGLLELTEEELEYIRQKTGTAADSQDYFDYWLFQRINDPQNYSVNGRLLSTFSLSEKFNVLYSYWKLGKPVNPLH
jgi:hypothetical protein